VLLSVILLYVVEITATNLLDEYEIPMDFCLHAAMVNQNHVSPILTNYPPDNPGFLDLFEYIEKTEDGC